MRNRFVHHLLHTAFIRHIANNAYGLATRKYDLMRNVSDLAGSPGRHNDPSSLASKSLDDSFANSTPTTGNDSNAVCEPIFCHTLYPLTRAHLRRLTNSRGGSWCRPTST